MQVTLEDIQKAYELIKSNTIRTPTVKAARLSAHLGIDLYMKLENIQYTNAFKARGALNKLLTLNEEERKNGVIACSAGNHAQGVAYHAQRLGIPATIVMPYGTPFNKIKKTEDFGAKVVLHGKQFDESVGETMRLAEEHNYTFIHPFDDKAVVAGQGTLAIEMLEQQPELDCVVVPIGGGGLIAGVATALKGLKPEIEVIGAQAAVFPAAKYAFDNKENPHPPGGTLAEGIAVKAPSKDNVAMMQNLVDRIEVASEAEIEEAIFDMISDEKLVAEGAAGAGLAVVKNNLEAFKGKKVGLVVCGGNIDSRLLSTLIMRGLVRDGRISRLRFEIDDTPGQLSDISRLIGESGANVIEVIHQRMMQTVSLKRAELDIVIEARDKMHTQEIVEILRNNGFVVHILSEINGS
ncbi:MAG: threonine ammonia-lyase [Alphaproteobacteria bacterium]|nr:threonine ammonia-lyase [Alphaproteobacteria bacterium]|tara:strand:- start:18130 stop:19353 length:1224 start_codon:yes stop_codon:yes gene_type:complete